MACATTEWYMRSVSQKKYTDIQQLNNPIKMKKPLDKNEPATDVYTVLSAGDKLELLKSFLTEHFDFKELKKAGFYKDINKTDYEKQAKRICDFFGYETVYEYGFNTTYAHITYVDGHRPEGEPFLTEFKAWHES